jgi:hypothetical protein
VKEAKLNRGENIAVQSQGVWKWMNKKPMSFTSIFNSDTMMAVSKTGRDLYKPRGI